MSPDEKNYMTSTIRLLHCRGNRKQNPHTLPPPPMDISTNYEIAATADFILAGAYTRVALQFPDHLLRHSTRVARALRAALASSAAAVRLFVMADTAYGSCCVDEVGASHVAADCVVHYGHACMSSTSTLPAFFVFGKATLDINAFADCFRDCLSTTEKPVLILYGLEYAHALDNIKVATADVLKLVGSTRIIDFAKVTCSSMFPLGEPKSKEQHFELHDNFITNGEVLEHGDKKLTQNVSLQKKAGKKYSLGGLEWTLSTGYEMENYLLFWIGSDNSSFSNVMLTFNSCEIVRYDAEEHILIKDFPQQKRILNRRYYLMEKAKDANIVGILVGTLSVAGYHGMVQQMKDLVEGAGKKSYTLVMGRPNSAKLANFPECDVFVYVSCAQTALLDSKELFAPVITPFEAVLAFSRGRQWTGDYVIEFQNLTIPSASEAVSSGEEARFSFIKGAYIEDTRPPGNDREEAEGSLALVEMREKALNLTNCGASTLSKGTARSGAEYLVSRSYQGLDVRYENPLPESYLTGRTGRASGYDDEKQQ